MPRKHKDSESPKKRTQTKLDTFLSSSPPAPSPRKLSPTRKPQTRSNLPKYQTQAKRKVSRRTTKASSPGPSRIPLDGRESSQSSDAGVIHFEPRVINVSDSSENEGAKPSPAKSLAGKDKKRPRIVLSDDEGEEVPAKKGRRLVKRARSPVLVDSDEEDEGARLPKRRQLTKKRPQSSEEEEEEDLMDEVDEKKIIKARFRKRDTRTAFQKNLERLKRKKRGEATQSSSEEEEDEEESDDDAPFSHARPDGVDEDDDEDGRRTDDVDDSFIVEDDTSQQVELPPEFSMGSYQDLLHHFKIVCQMFVHMAVHDEDEREQVALELQSQQYFSVPLKITRRKLEGMRDSLVAGSTWKTSFRRALNRYPDYEEQHLDFWVPGCDACHLGARKSTKQGRLSGLPYDKLSYDSFPEELTDTDEDEESEESSRKREFVFGRFCAKRTRTYHRFTHWEYHLFHALREEVDALKTSRDDRSFVKVAYAKGKQPPRDLKDADAIMDWLDERQVINFQWQEVKTMMEDALHLEARGKRGDDSD